MPKELPNEVWLNVLGHLGRHDLASISRSNKALRELARPLFYKFATFSRVGLHFPNAPNPYPFTDLPEFGQVALPREERKRIVADLRRLEVRPHTLDDCSMFKFMSRQSLHVNLDVLWIEMVPYNTERKHAPKRSSTAASMAPFSWNQDAGPRDAIRHPAIVDEWASDLYGYTLASCGFDSRLSSATARKVVIRNALIGGRANRDCRLPETDRTKDFVLVVNSAHMSRRSLTGSPCATDWGHHESWHFGPSPDDDDDLENLTIVFWTGSPESRWVPPCGHDREEVASGASNGTKCFAVFNVWNGIMELVSAYPKLRHLTVVNAEAFVSWYAETSSSGVEDNVHGSTRDVFGLYERLRSHFDRHHAYKQARFDILRMGEWARRGEWDDVFASQEIRPFLEAEQAVPT